MPRQVQCVQGPRSVLKAWPAGNEAFGGCAETDRRCWTGDHSIRAWCLDKAGCRSFVLTRSCSVKAGARLPDNKRFPKATAQVTDPLNLRTFSVINFRTPDRAKAKIPEVPHEHITNNEKISHAGILYKREINTKFAENHICYYHRRRK